MSHTTQNGVLISLLQGNQDAKDKGLHGELLHEGPKQVISEKPLSLEFTPLEVYIYGTTIFEL